MGKEGREGEKEGEDRREGEKRRRGREKKKTFYLRIGFHILVACRVWKQKPFSIKVLLQLYCSV